MSVPPQGPRWARPDQPGGPSRPGGPVPPAPTGQPLRPGQGAAQGGPARFSPSGAPSAGHRSAPRWPGDQQGQQGQQQGPPPQQMLGNEAMAGAAEAARRHAASRIVDTSTGKDDGLDKCPRCGSAEIHYSLTTKSLVCGYCRHSWNEQNVEQAFGLNSPIAELRGHTLASGTADVREDLTVVTLKCQGCGAEVVINVEQELQARCHWCRQTLSINTQIPNGAVPDAVLPFLLTREEAIQRIDAFSAKRRAFADSRFKREFVPENVMGVYIPYLVVDGNMHAVLQGTGEVTTRQYTVTTGSGDNRRSTTYYDADVYSVQRSFDLLVDDLTVESAERFDSRDNQRSTNNILDAVQPYDTENAVAYNSNYLKNFTSERRDLNVRDVDHIVEEDFLSIARAKVLPTLRAYDRGVRWQNEGVAVHGTRWVSIYVPVWLFSYSDSAKGPNSLVHYIAVNARNGNTMGSIPVSHPKIFAVACAAGGIAAAIGALFAFGYLLT